MFGAEAIVKFNFNRDLQQVDFRKFDRTPCRIDTKTFVTGIFQFHNATYVNEHLAGTGEIKFLASRDYPPFLWEGKRIRLYMGTRKVIGYATVLQVLDTNLMRTPPQWWVNRQKVKYWR
jgi:hypothetical protein